MPIGEPTELTYQDFVRLRASALRTLHASQSLLHTCENAGPSICPEATVETARQSVNTAQMLLAALLDRWARSRYNRSE